MLQEKQRVDSDGAELRDDGAELEVLVSNKSRREKQWSGHTTSNRVINFSSQRARHFWEATCTCG